MTNRKNPQWQVVDFRGDVVFDADFINTDPVVSSGTLTAREYAKYLVKENNDSDAPGPLVAQKVS